MDDIIWVVGIIVALGTAINLFIGWFGKTKKAGVEWGQLLTKIETLITDSGENKKSIGDIKNDVAKLTTSNTEIAGKVAIIERNNKTAFDRIDEIRNEVIHIRNNCPNCSKMKNKKSTTA